MNKLLSVGFVVLLTSFIMAGCTKTNEVGNNSTSPEAPKSQAKAVGVDEVMSAIEAEVEVIEGPMRTSFRKDVDDYMNNGDGMGFYARLTQEDPSIASEMEKVNGVMKKFGFSKKEGNPKNDSSPIISFVKYELGELLCTIEVKKIGATENADIILGCD